MAKFNRTSGCFKPEKYSRGLTNKLDVKSIFNKPKKFGFDMTFITNDITKPQPIQYINKLDDSLRENVSNILDKYIPDDLCQFSTLINIKHGILIARMCGINVLMIDYDENSSTFLRVSDTNTTYCMMISDEPYQHSQRTEDKGRIRYMSWITMNPIALKLLYQGECIFSECAWPLATNQCHIITITNYYYDTCTYDQLTIEQFPAIHMQHDSYQEDPSIIAAIDNNDGLGNYVYNPTLAMRNNIRYFNSVFTDSPALVVDDDVRHVVQLNGTRSIPKYNGGSSIINVKCVNHWDEYASYLYAGLPKRLFLAHITSGDLVICLKHYLLQDHKCIDGIFNTVVSLYGVLDECGCINKVVAAISYLERVNESGLIYITYPVDRDNRCIDLYNGFSEGLVGTDDLNILEWVFNNCESKDVKRNQLEIFDKITWIELEVRQQLVNYLTTFNRKSSSNYEVSRFKRLTSKFGGGFSVVIKPEDVVNMFFGYVINLMPNKPRYVNGRFLIDATIFSKLEPDISLSEVTKFAVDFTLGIPLSVRDSIAMRIDLTQLPNGERNCTSDQNLNSLISFTTYCRPTTGLLIDNTNVLNNKCHVLQWDDIKVVGKNVVLPCGYVTTIDNRLLHRHSCMRKYHHISHTDDEIAKRNRLESIRNMNEMLQIEYLQDDYKNIDRIDELLINRHNGFRCNVCKLCHRNVFAKFSCEAKHIFDDTVGYSQIINYGRITKRNDKFTKIYNETYVDSN